VTEPAPAPTAPAFRVPRLLAGLGIGVLGHVLVFAAAFVAARTTEDTGGWEDLAALATVLLLGQAVLLLGAVVATTVLAMRRRGDLALGVGLGWLVGAAFAASLLWGF
jgi:hypothetical protein